MRDFDGQGLGSSLLLNRSPLGILAPGDSLSRLKPTSLKKLNSLKYIQGLGFQQLEGEALALRPPKTVGRS